MTDSAQAVRKAKKVKPAKKKKLRSLEKQQRTWGWLFLAPWLVGTIAFFIFPVLQSFVYSFSKINITGNGFELESVGFKNYFSLFVENTDFFPLLMKTVLGIIPSVAMILAFSTIIALVLKEKFIGRSLARGVFFFPVIIASGVVITILKEQVMMSGAAVSDMAPSYLFHAPNLIDTFAALGIPEQILKSITTILNQIFDLTWKSGVQILMLLAAVNNIPASFYEVGDMEGATAWEKFWKITFPTISPIMLVTVIYTIIDSFTDYGNEVMKLMRSYYENTDYAFSATIGVSYFVCILLLIGLVELICRKFVFYSTED